MSNPMVVALEEGRAEVLAAVAVLTHVLVVWAIPYVIMAALSASRPAEERGTGPLFPPMTDATSRRVVMPSPDLLYASCAFDLSKGPWRIRADPKAPHYWSIAMYAANSDNFFVVNDLEYDTGDDLQGPRVFLELGTVF